MAEYFVQIIPRVFKTTIALGIIVFYRALHERDALFTLIVLANNLGKGLKQKNRSEKFLWLRASCEVSRDTYTMKSATHHPASDGN